MQSRRLTSATTYGSGQVALDYLVVRAPTDLETFIVTISDDELACSCVANRATTAPCIHVRTFLRGYSANRLAEPLPRAEQPGQARAERHAYLQPTGASRVSTALTQREGEVLRMMVGGLTIRRSGPNWRSAPIRSRSTFTKSPISSRRATAPRRSRSPSVSALSRGGQWSGGGRYNADMVPWPGRRQSSFRTQ